MKQGKIPVGRTYVRRRGRMTQGQHRALETLADDRVLSAEAPGPVDWCAMFDRDGPLGLEIGFGMGQALLDWAANEPGWCLVGAEVYQPGIGSLLLGLEREGLDNVRVIDGDAVTALDTLFAPESLSEVRIFFPDPWPKKKHHKRRLIQPAFLSTLATRMREGALLRLATDWQPYAEWMLEVCESAAEFANTTTGYAPRPDCRPITRFEARGQRLGHPVRDLCYQRLA